MTTPPDERKAAEGKYGEPWSDNDALIEHGMVKVCQSPLQWSRAVACVNALTGVAEPGAELQRLRNECEAMKSLVVDACECAIEQRKLLAEYDKSDSYGVDGIQELIEGVIADRDALRAENAALREACEMVLSRWTFDNYQQHTHTWHDMQDCSTVIRRATKLKGANDAA